MNLVELFKKIEEQQNRTISQAELARALESSAPAVNKRLKGDSEVTVSELMKLQKHYGFDIDYILTGKKRDSIELKYWEIPNKCSKKIKNPLITSIWLDRELIINDWIKDPKPLRTIKMIGDRMSGGDYPLKNGDTLIIDTSESEIINSGIYVFTSMDNSNIFISGVRKNLDGSITFFCTNKEYENITYSLEQLQERDFRVVGRVVKNLSLIL